MIFNHLFNYGVINFSFILQNGWFLHFYLCKYVFMHTISYVHLVLYKYVMKELELQNSNWFSLFKPNNDALHIRKTYFIHFKTNLNNFCDFECAKCRTTKYFWSSKIIEQWPKIVSFKSQVGFINLNQTMTLSL